MGRFVVRALLGLLGLLILLAAAGLVYQTAAAWNDRRRVSRPGEMVDAGGFRLHLKVMGQEHPGPTVILENGGSGIVPQWGWIQPEIAQFARVVAYDRPGTGWSEAPPEPFDAAGSAQALRNALEVMEIDGPYILVGHSMGGLMARVFAQRYPEDVAGMVLVDPRGLTWEGVFAEEEAQVPTGLFRVLGFLSHFGVTRLSGFAANQVEGLPGESYQQAVAIGSTPKYMKGLLDDARYGETAIDFLQAGEDLGNLPIIVLSAGAADPSFNARQRENFTALQAGFSARLAGGEHRIVPGAGHSSIIMEQEHAAVVTETVREMVQRVSGS